MSIHSSLKILKREPAFAALIKKHGAPGGERRGDPFQSLVRSIVYQQVSGKAAATILARFVALFSLDKSDLHTPQNFPTPAQVVAMPVEKMREAGLSGQKVSYIKDLAEKFASGVIPHQNFATMTSDEIANHLLTIKGVGRWTTHMFLISTMGRADILPVGDLGIQKGFQIIYNLKKLPDEKTMERLAKPWRAHASAATWYLWRAADEAKIIKKPKPAAKPKLKVLKKRRYTK